MLVLIGVPIFLGVLAFGFFYSVFYFPNWTSATTETIISSAEKREYLLYVPKGYDRANPTPLVINLHTSMSWPSSAMASSQWNRVADERGLMGISARGGPDWSFNMQSLHHFAGSVILNVWFSLRPLLTTCLRPEGQSTSMRSILPASPRPK